MIPQTITPTPTPRDNNPPKHDFVTGKLCMLYKQTNKQNEQQQQHTITIKVCGGEAGRGAVFINIAW